MVPFFLTGADHGWMGRVLKIFEEFSDPPPEGVVNLVPQIAPQDAEEGEDENDPVVPLSSPPKTLMEWAVLILNTPNPILKVCFLLLQ